MPEPAFLQATLPLFSDGLVDTIEWSMDMSWGGNFPVWLEGLVREYGAAGALVGHGVSLSPLSEHPRQEQWFERFAADVRDYTFGAVSEHFGFMAAGPFHRGPPFPVPMNSATLATGRKRLERLASVCDQPVGLENLAFAFGSDDMWNQGAFIDALLEPVDGYLVLDAHNLYCQLHNFDTDVDELLDTYPLERVRECHVSGGSWSTSPNDAHRRIRRDTHDGPVPDGALAVLERLLARCPNVERVIVERIGSSLGRSDPGEAHHAGEQFRADYVRTRELVATATRATPLATAAVSPTGAASPVGATDTWSPGHPGTSTERGGTPELAQLLEILDTAASAEAAISAAASAVAGSDPSWQRWVDQMDPAMVHVAQELMTTWAVRQDRLS
jgi:uncharacterized protein (UPF0276 family)